MPPRPSPWKAKVLLRAHASQTKVRERQGYVDMGRIQMNVGDPILPMLAAVAARRGLRPSAYCRRAVAAFIAADLNVPLAEITQHMAHPGGQTVAPADDGLGHGPWMASAFLDDTDVH